MSYTLYVLGAPDPEMQAIERLLSETGQHYVYALGPDGRRVHTGNAYQAQPVEHDGPMVLVECGWPDQDTATVIDHHRPGDPGYGRPPEEFLPASSLGQVISSILSLGRQIWPGLPGDRGALLPLQPPGAVTPGWGWAFCPDETLVGAVPIDLVLTAAADHCLAAAYRGECPGVDPDELMRWRAASRAEYQRRSVGEVLADVEAAIAALRAAPRVVIADVEVADLGDTTVPEAPEAACRIGMPFLATVTERDGRRKQVLQAAPPAVIEAWPHDYGDPARGFAGQYLD